MNFTDSKELDFLTFIRTSLIRAEDSKNFEEYLRLLRILKDTVLDTELAVVRMLEKK